MRSTGAVRFLVVLATAVALLGAGCSSDRSSDTGTGSGADGADRSTDEVGDFAGYVRSPASDVSTVVLPDVDGGEVTMVAPSNGFRLVFFGYTTCPDVCPATLGYIKIALNSLPDPQRERVVVDMITVDPARDDPATLSEYVRRFVPTANALRTDDDRVLRAAADAFGADYSITPDDDGEPEVSHTGDLYVVDDAGTVVLAWPFGSSPADIETDLRRLLDGERPEGPDTNSTNHKESG